MDIPGGLNTTLDNTGSAELYTSYNTSPEYAQQLTVTAQTRGLVTWTAIRVLETPDFIYSVNLYDGKGRLIQTKTKNNTGGTDIFTTQYNWAGQPIKTVNKTEKAGTNAQTITVVNRMSYDDLARLVKVDKKIAHSGINSGALSANWVTILEQEYDAIGQMTKKTIGNKKRRWGFIIPPRQPLQELVHDYNIRGWLLGTNRDYLTSNDQTTDGKLFGFELGYDNLSSKAGNNFSAAQYNGNISGMTWKSDGDDIRRRYDFSYDGANRLLKAEFKQNNSSTATWNKTLADFTVQMGNSGADDGTAYDANGNILKMKQWGLKLTGPTQIDNLTYTYHAGGNQLKAVTESGTGTTDHGLGDFTDKNTSATDYGYDRNGNLIIDLNKQLKGAVAPNTDMLSGGAILYNYLNLPYQMTVRNDAGTADKGTISYVYNATGLKLKKITVENGVSVMSGGSPVTTNITTTTTYLNDAVFESKQYSDGTVNTALGYTDRLQFFAQEEGRVRAVNDPVNQNTLTALEYEYMIKDHLDNVRMVLTERVKEDKYAATMELAQAATENTFFSNLDATRSDKPSGYPADATTDPNVKAAKVQGAGNKIGPAILLKVMAGDKISIMVNSWWSSGSSPVNGPNPLTEVASALAGSIGGLAGGKYTGTQLASSGLPLSAADAFLDNQGYASGKPKAYINCLLLDEQFKAVITNDGKNSWTEQVAGSGVWGDHHIIERELTKSGYLYIYTSNVTENIDVYFDNLLVTHVRGPLLEESHYYPFGLTMAGISSKALEFGNLKNKEQTFQGQKFDDDLSLNWIQFKWRTHDPQIGKFLQIDPFADKYRYNSHYAFSENKVIAHRELEGLEAWTVNNSDGTTETFHGPYAHQQAAQRAYESRLKINGEQLNWDEDGMVTTDEIIIDRKLQSQESGPLKSVTGIVLHRTAGGSVSGAVTAMKIKGLGVHFIVDLDGTITQLASLNFWVSHVGSPKHPDWIFRSTNTIGIEFVGRWYDETESWDPVPDAQIKSGAWLVKSLMRTYNVAPYNVRNHEDLRKKMPNEGKVVRDAISIFIYQVNEDENTDKDRPAPRTIPVFY